MHDIGINAYKCYFLQKLFDGMHELEGSIMLKVSRGNRYKS